MSIDIEDLAKSNFADALVNNDGDCPDLGDVSHEIADNACIYTSQCREIIQQYDSAEAEQFAEEIGGQQYTAAEWEKAMTAYAYCCARTAADATLYELEKDLKEKRELLDAVTPAFTEIKCGHSLILGHFAHDREDENNILHWERRQCDGLNGAAIRLECDAWLYATWEVEE